MVVHTELVKRQAHINGIENFLGLAKMRLARFRGLEPFDALLAPQRI